MADHLTWLLEHDQYQRAWEILDEYLDILTTPSNPSQKQGSADFYDDETVADSAYRGMYSSAEKEKRCIGELWVHGLIEEGSWTLAGQVCGKVITTPDRWEKWVCAFAGANRFDEITNYIPSEPMHPPLPIRK
ncbi:hypothetical protein VE02_04534 [Pseudogymnoascus sp. 03VT05]|nr:hypothetical protein VE02_04534 [Pseudogymnoascus sp. 03VT05]